MSLSPFDRMTRRCVHRFGIDTVYIRADEETPVKGIFDNEFQSVVLDGEPPISSRSIQVGYHKDALPYPPKKGDHVRIRGVLYRVAEPQQDGEFGITLILKKAEA